MFLTGTFRVPPPLRYSEVKPVNLPLQQFVSIALPIMVTLVATIWLASWSQNKRFDEISNRIGELTTTFHKRIDDLRSEMNARSADLRSEMNARFADMNRRFDEVVGRLDRIEKKLDNHEERIVRLEERTSPIR